MRRRFFSAASDASLRGTHEVRDNSEMERPAGTRSIVRDNTSLQAPVYTQEQQLRLGVDEMGNPRQVRQTQAHRCDTGGAMLVSHSHGLETAENFLQSWEDRLRWREAELKESEKRSNAVFAKSRATPCLSLSCAACQLKWSDRGMQVMLVDSPDSDLYQADRQPSAIIEARQDKDHNLCRCRVRDLYCTCHQSVGYHVLEQCPDCKQDTEDTDAEFQWFFYSHTTRIAPRKDDVTGETIMWPGTVIKTIPADWANGENDENQRPQNGQENDYIDGTWQCSPLADRNGRWTSAEVGRKEALEQREEACKLKEAQQLDEQTRQFEKERLLKDTDAELRKQEEIVRDQFANVALREKAADERTASIEAQERQLQDKVSSQEQEVAAIRARAWQEAAEARAQAQQAVEIAKEQAESRTKDAKLAVQQAQQNVLFAEVEAESLRGQLAGQTQAAEAAKAHTAQLEKESKELRRILMEERQQERRRSSMAGPLPRQDEVSPTSASRIKELEESLSMANSKLLEATSKCKALEREKAGIQVQVAQLHDRIKIRDTEIDNLKCNRDSPAGALNESSDDFDYIQTRLERVQKLAERREELAKWQDSLALRERTLAKAQDELERRELEVTKVEDALGIGPAGAPVAANQVEDRTGLRFRPGSDRFAQQRHYTSHAGGIGYRQASDGSGVPPIPGSRGGLLNLFCCQRRRSELMR